MSDECFPPFHEPPPLRTDKCTETEDEWKIVDGKLVKWSYDAPNILITNAIDNIYNSNNLEAEATTTLRSPPLRRASSTPSNNNNSYTKNCSSSSSSSPSACSMCLVLQQQLQGWKTECLKLQTLTSTDRQIVDNLEEENRNQAAKIQELQERIDDLAQKNFKLMIELGNLANQRNNSLDGQQSSESDNENEDNTVEVLNEQIKTLSEQLETEKDNHFITQQLNLTYELKLAESRSKECTCKGRPYQPTAVHYGYDYSMVHQPQMMSPLYPAPMASWPNRCPQSNPPSPNVQTFNRTKNDITSSHSGQLTTYTGGAQNQQNRFRPPWNGNVQGTRFRPVSIPMYFPPPHTPYAPTAFINICFQ